MKTLKFGGETSIGFSDDEAKGAQMLLDAIFAQLKSDIKHYGSVSESRRDEMLADIVGSVTIE